MNIEISNETYLKLKNEALKYCSDISDEKIKEYLIECIDKDHLIQYFGYFVCAKEESLREKNTEYALQCDNCNHIFDNKEEYFVVYEGKVGEEILCKDCFDNYKYGKENVKKYIYSEE